MDQTYADVYPDLYVSHWWWRVRESILLRRIHRILGSRRDTRILDVGCGAGLFFEHLELFGHVEGIESDADSLSRAGRWQNRITHGELDTSFQPAQPFDLILMLDVLEHLEHPVHVLRRAFELLVPHGSVLVTVPAFEWLWTGHDDLNHHRRRYTASQLRTALRHGGFVDIETRYLFQSLLIPKLVVRSREAVAGRSSRLPSIPSPALNVSLRAWYQAENALAGWMPFGSSVLAQARRA